MDIQDTKNIANKVEGWLSYGEGKTLYNLAKNCTGRGVIVEIGSWKGKSTIWIGHGSKKGNNVKIYAIDPHTGSSEHQKDGENIWTFEEFKKNIEHAHVDDVIVPIIKTSEEAAQEFTEPVEFIFIDGDHEYDKVKLDFEFWFPKVINGGVMAFHDTSVWKGPRKVVTENVFKSKHFRAVRFVDSMTYARKTKRNNLMDRIRSRWVLLLKNLYVFMAKQRLPKPITTIAKKIAYLLQ